MSSTAYKRKRRSSSSSLHVPPLPVPSSLSQASMKRNKKQTVNSNKRKQACKYSSHQPQHQHQEQHKKKHKKNQPSSPTPTPSFSTKKVAANSTNANTKNNSNNKNNAVEKKGTDLLPLILKVEAAIQISIVTATISSSARNINRSSNNNSNNYNNSKKIHEMSLNKLRSIVRKSIPTLITSSVMNSSAESLTISESSASTSASTSCGDIDYFELLEIDEQIIVVLLFITDYHNEICSMSTSTSTSTNMSTNRIISHSKDLSKIMIHQNNTFPLLINNRCDNVKDNDKGDKGDKGNKGDFKNKTQSRMNRMKQLYQQLWQNKKWKQHKEHCQKVHTLSKQIMIQLRKKGAHVSVPAPVPAGNGTGEERQDSEKQTKQTKSTLNSNPNRNETELLQQHTKRTTNRTNEISLSTSSSKIVEHYIKPNMTLEERVRARAENSRQLRRNHNQNKNKKNSTSNSFHENDKSNENDVNDNDYDGNIVRSGAALLLETKKKRKHEQISSSTGNKNDNNNNNSNSTNTDTGMNDVNLVRFADALRLYVRHSSNRSHSFGRLGSVGGAGRTTLLNSDNDVDNNNNSNGNLNYGKSDTGPRFVNITLDDVRTHLKRVVGGGRKSTSASASTSNVVGLSEKRFTSKDITEVIKRLCERVPEWISLTVKRMKTNNSCTRRGEKSGHSAIIRLCENIPYQSIREKLGIERRIFQQTMDNNNGKGKEGKGNDGEHIDNGMKSNTDQSLQEESESFNRGNADSSSSQTSSQKSTQTSPQKSKHASSTNRTIPQPQIVRITESHKKKEASHGLLAVVSSLKKRKGSKLSLSARRNMKNDAKNTKSKTVVPGKTFLTSSSSDDEDPEALLRAAGIEQKKRLRVNHCQHLTDADMDGGEVIQSTSTNPRGLKRMFSRLNAGERI